MARTRYDTIGNTMGAVVLGNDPYESLNNNLATVRQAELVRQEQARQQAQQLAQSYRDNALKVQGGRLWANEIAGLAGEHMKRGIGYRQQGRNIYDMTDPDNERYMLERANIEALDSYRKAIESDVTKQLEELRKAAPGTYDPRSVDELNRFLNETTAQQAYSQGLQPPQLRKIFNPQDLLKDVNAVVTKTGGYGNNTRWTETAVDRPATERVIVGRLMADPQGAQFLNQVTGGIPVNQLKSFPDSLEANVKEIREEYEGNPQLREQMALDLGVTSVDSPEFNQVAQTIAQTRLNAKRSFNDFINQQVDAAKVSSQLGRVETPDFTEANYRERILSRQLSERREARLAAGESASEVAEDPVDLMIPYGPYNPEGNQPQVQARNYIPMSIPNRNFVGSEAIDLYTGRPTQIGESSADYSIVGVTQVPVSKNPIKGGVPKGSLVQPGFASSNPGSVEWKQVVHVTKGDGEDYFVDINRLPKNLTKDQKALVDRFKQAAGNSTSSPASNNDPLGLF